jgi:hypothetical protein
LALQGERVARALNTASRAACACRVAAADALNGACVRAHTHALQAPPAGARLRVWPSSVVAGDGSSSAPASAYREVSAPNAGYLAKGLQLRHPPDAVLEVFAPPPPPPPPPPPDAAVPAGGSAFGLPLCTVGGHGVSAHKRPRVAPVAAFEPASMGGAGAIAPAALATRAAPTSATAATPQEAAAARAATATAGADQAAAAAAASEEAQRRKRPETFAMTAVWRRRVAIASQQAAAAAAATQAAAAAAATAAPHAPPPAHDVRCV